MTDKQLRLVRLVERVKSEPQKSEPQNLDKNQIAKEAKKN